MPVKSGKYLNDNYLKEKPFKINSKLVENNNWRLLRITHRNLIENEKC